MNMVKNLNLWNLFQKVKLSYILAWLNVKSLQMFYFFILMIRAYS